MSKIFKNVQNFHKCQIFKNVQNVQNFIVFMIFGHNCSCPITRDCAFVYTNLLILLSQGVLSLSQGIILLPQCHSTSFNFVFTLSHCYKASFYCHMVSFNFCSVFLSCLIITGHIHNVTGYFVLCRYVVYHFGDSFG